MTFSEQNIIERDVHCPYCKENKALLISGAAEKKMSLGWPAWGLRFWLRAFFTFGLSLLVDGGKMVELDRSIKYRTFGFCPLCGNSYQIDPYFSTKAEKARKKLYTSVNDRKVFGICGGIAEYTDLSPTIIRGVLILWTLAEVYAVVMMLITLITFAIQDQTITLSYVWGLFSASALPLLTVPASYLILGASGIIPERPKGDQNA